VNFFTMSKSEPATKYSREYLLSFQPMISNSPPPPICQVIQSLYLDKGSPFPSKSGTNKEKSLESPSKLASSDEVRTQNVKAVATRTPKKPSEAAAASSLKAIPPSLVIPPTTTPKRIPFTTISSKTPIPVITQPPSTPLRTPTHPSKNIISVSLNKENVINSQQHQQTTPLQPPKMQTPKTQTKSPKIEIKPLQLPLTPSPSKKREAESDEHRLAQRQKQIEYGYKTIGYQMYLSTVPKSERQPGNVSHPVTPRKNQKCSKRSWDGQVRKWRRLLHVYDTTDEQQIAYWQAIIKEKYGDCDSDDPCLADFTPSPSPVSPLTYPIDHSELKPRTLVF